MLVSTFLGSSSVIGGMSEGEPLPDGPCGEDAVRATKLAVVAVGGKASDSELNGELDESFLAALTQFRDERGLEAGKQPIDAVILQRLDFELAFLEGYIAPDIETRLLQDPALLRLDPFRSALLGTSLGLQGLDKKIVDAIQDYSKAQELGDRFCLRLSLDLGAPIASFFSKELAEPKIFEDFCKINGPCTSVFFDKSPSFKAYEAFLLANNAGKLGLAKVARMSRPDIVSHRPPDFDWYEVKPMSLAGMRDALEKLVELLGIYLVFGLPYRPGSRYTPTRSIKLGQLMTPTGQPLTIFLDVERSMKGLIFWTLCIEGDYVEYFHRYKMVVGILQILGGLVALAAEAGAVGGVVAEGAAVLKSLTAIAAGLGLAMGPFLRPAPAARQ